MLDGLRLGYLALSGMLVGVRPKSLIDYICSCPFALERGAFSQQHPVSPQEWDPWVGDLQSGRLETRK